MTAAATTKAHTPVKNAYIQFEPYPQYVNIIHDLAKGDVTFIPKGLEQMAYHLKQLGAELTHVKEKDKPDVFVLSLKKMGGFDFVSMGQSMTGARSSGMAIKEVWLLNSNKVGLASYLAGESNFTDEFIYSHRLS